MYSTEFANFLMGTSSCDRHHQWMVNLVKTSSTSRAEQKRDIGTWNNEADPFIFLSLMIILSTQRKKAFNSTNVAKQ